MLLMGLPLAHKQKWCVYEEHFVSQDGRGYRIPVGNGWGTLHRQYENPGRLPCKAGSKNLKRGVSLKHLAEGQLLAPRIIGQYSELYFLTQNTFKPHKCSLLKILLIQQGLKAEAELSNSDK